MTNKKKIPIALAIAVVIILCGLIFVIMDKSGNVALEKSIERGKTQVFNPS